MRPEVLAVLNTLRSELGAEEEPRGSNRGPKIKKYLAATGLPEGYPWCAAVIAWAGREAASESGFVWPLPLSADCDVLLAAARKLNILKTKPQPGDLGLVLRSTYDATHVFMVEEVNADGSLQTLEGNSNTNGSREGYKMVRLDNRPHRSFLRFVRWIDVVESRVKPWKVLLFDKAGIPHPLSENAFLHAGSAYIPARESLEKLGAQPKKYLGWDSERMCLSWNGQPVPADAMLKDGLAWAGARELATWLKVPLSVDGPNKVITLGSVKGY